MTYLLDTNACIRYLNGECDVIRDKLEFMRSGEVVLCSVVRAELLYGALKSIKLHQNMERLTYFFRGFACLPFDEAASDVYARIRTELEKTGIPIGPNDLLIAATAMANKLTLVTHNTREFGRIEGLSLEDWEVTDS